MRPLAYLDDDFLYTEKLHAFDDVLLPGEQIEHIASISPGIYWKGIAMFIVAIIAMFYGFALGVFLMMVAGILFLTAYTTKKYMMLASTNMRLILGGGFFNQEIIYLPYTRLEGVETVRTPFGMLFGYANILLTGTGRMRVMVPYVEDAGGISDDISARMVLPRT